MSPLVRTRGKGWLEDARRPEDQPIGALLATYRTARDAGAASVLRFRKRRMYQGRASACVAFALSRAIHTSLASQLEGETAPSAIPEPSPWHIYYNARMIQHAGKDPKTLPPPLDTGSYPRHAIEAVRRLGFAEWSFAPYNAMLVNERPPNCAFREAFDQSGLNWYVLDEHTGVSRSQIVAECLRAKPAIPVVFGMPVDQPLEDWKGPSPISSIDLSLKTGNHMLAVEEVRPNGEILFDNWWEDWGIEDGFGLMTPELFGSSLIRNVYAILPVPTYS